MYILFDIGATNTRIARANGLDKFEEPIIIATPNTYEEGLEVLVAKIKEISQEEEITLICGGIAGRWDGASGSITESGNLSLWCHKPFRNDLENAFKCKVFIDNDAAVVGLGEAKFGAGRGQGLFLYMTVSTGVGGAFIGSEGVEDRIEPRLQVVNDKGDTLEKLISGRAIEEKMGMKPEEITDKDLWDSCAKILASGLAQIISGREVGCVVLGGSMMNDVGISVSIVREYLAEFLPNQNVVVLRGALGTLGGLYGALAMASKNSLK